MVRCDECGFDGERLAVVDLGPTIRELGPRFSAVLRPAGEGLARKRPRPEVWSPIEYASHVRDVLLVQRDRIVLACVEERPSLARMHREERVSLCRYDAFPLHEVLQQLAAAAELCAVVFGGLGQAEWDRRLVYNWPEPAEHDLAWLGRHTVHEGVHHLRDVRLIVGAGGQAER